jgi:hypothetical protein
VKTRLALAAVIVLTACAHGVGGRGTTASSSASSSPSSTAPSSAPSSPSSRASSATPTVAPKACAGACFTDPSQVSTILAAAQADTARVNSYDYRTLDQDRAAGLAVTTGEFRRSYRSAMSTVVSQAAKVHATQTAQSNQAGVQAISNAGTRATVIVVGQLVQANTSSGSPRTTPFTASVTLDLIGQHWLISSLHIGGDGADTTSLPGSSALKQAAAAGAAELHHILTFSRANFASDFQAALVGATDPLRSDLAKNEARTRAALTSGHFDLTGQVTGVAVVSADDTTVKLLLIAESRHTGGNAPSVSSEQREVVTMKHVGGSWLAADLASIGVQ